MVVINFEAGIGSGSGYGSGYGYGDGYGSGDGDGYGYGGKNSPLEFSPDHSDALIAAMLLALQKNFKQQTKQTKNHETR